jgi:hypothetical protein
MATIRRHRQKWQVQIRRAGLAPVSKSFLELKPPLCESSFWCHLPPKGRLAIGDLWMSNSTKKPYRSGSDAAVGKEPIFTGKDKSLWYEQIALDPRVSPLALRVGCVVGSHVNRYEGSTFVGRDRIAQLLNISTKSVDRMISQLEGYGHLHVTRYPGRHRSNRYSPIVHKNDEQHAKIPAPPVESGTLASRPETQTGTTEVVNGDKLVQKGRPACPPNQNLLNTADNHESNTKRVAMEPEFDCPSHDLKTGLRWDSHSQRGLTRLRAAFAPTRLDRDTTLRKLLQVCPSDGPTSALVQTVYGWNENLPLNEENLVKAITLRMPRKWTIWEAWRCGADLKTIGLSQADWPLPPETA